MPLPSHFKIAIIGAGFSGTMAAIHLAQRYPEAPILLIERQEAPALGLAYSTSDPDHLLNVRAGQMGAMPDAIDAFYVWLGQHKNYVHYSKDDFVPRYIYGAYLQGLLRTALQKYPHLQCLTHDVSDITQNSSGFTLYVEGDAKISAEKIILALGNFPPALSEHKAELTPYAATTWTKIADDGDVLLIGTGLTCLDLVATMARTKSSGHIHLLSRHGLVPQEHVPTKPYTLSFDCASMRPTALNWCRTLRAEVRKAALLGFSWHCVIDALRPYNQHIWMSFSLDEKRRFLRHLRVYWDIHRHRCAPLIMDKYRKLEQAGRLSLHHGSIIERKATDKGLCLTWRPRNTNRREQIEARHVIVCTGPQGNFRNLNDTLVQNLLKKGMICADDVEMGIITDNAFHVISEQGVAQTSLYAIGGLLKGRLFESIAVPELRVQAYDIAQHISL